MTIAIEGAISKTIGKVDNLHITEGENENLGIVTPSHDLVNGAALKIGIKQQKVQ